MTDNNQAQGYPALRNLVQEETEASNNSPLSHDENPYPRRDSLKFNAKDIITGTDDKQEVVPTDNITYFIFFVWGIGVLLPWNAVMTVFDYFEDEVSDYNL